MQSPLFWILMREYGAPPSLQKNPQSLSTHPKNRTTVEVTIHIPAPPHRDGAARLSTEPLVPCRRNQLRRARVLRAPIVLTAASFLGHRKLFIVKQKRIDHALHSEFLRPATGPQSEQVICAMSRSAPRRPLTMGRSLTTWHHKLTGHRPGRGEDHHELLEKSSHPLSTRKGGLMAHKALKAHSSPAPKSITRTLTAHSARIFT